MGDETAEELSCSSLWPLLHSESLPSDADSGYEPSPAFTSARASFEWPPASEDDAAVEPSEMRSAAIPIPGRRQPPPLWPSDTVDVATQTLSLGEWPCSEAAHPGGNPRPTPDLLFLPPPLFSATLVNLVGTTLPPDLVPRIEEQQQRVPSYPSVMAGVQLRRIADEFARQRPPSGRRRSFPLSFFRFD
ncbi:hypothetical protein HPB52_021795 [Rhipicephalus sanguineus]|uniref:Uncharacterized protein n=1 Tax=Rhipicephalus sanguineus TaxID=34632 RepID=A0A9D4QBS5_RHISA|nr:hypothetical protein HPB52_021795 [Rhipicephalus sanguineus]